MWYKFVALTYSNEKWVVVKKRMMVEYCHHLYLTTTHWRYLSEEISSVTGDLFRIRVKGYLDPERSGWLDGFAITHTTTGETLLSGPIVDQAALQAYSSQYEIWACHCLK